MEHITLSIPECLYNYYKEIGEALGEPTEEVIERTLLYITDKLVGSMFGVDIGMVKEEKDCR